MFEIDTQSKETPLEETPPSTSKPAFWVFVFFTFAGYIALDLLTPCCFQEPFPAIFLMILLVGQLTLICVWGTLVEGTFWFRLPWTILLLVISWAALCCGGYLDLGYTSTTRFLAVGLAWLYGFVISYVPIKIAAWAFGWRIRLVTIRDDEESRQYAIRDIMIGTAILAVTLAIGRNFLPDELPPWSEVLRESGLDNGEVLIAFFLFSVISLIVKLPCIWIALATDEAKLLRQSIIWFFCSGLLGLVEMGLLLMILGDPGSEGLEFVCALVAGHSAMAASMICVLYGLRRFGYRMSRKQKSTLAKLVDS